MSGVGRRRWAVSGSIVTGDWCGCCCSVWKHRDWRLMRLLLLLLLLLTAAVLTVLVRMMAAVQWWPRLSPCAVEPASQRDSRHRPGDRQSPSSPSPDTSIQRQNEQYKWTVSHLHSLQRDFWRHFGSCRAATHNDCRFFCAVYKYSYLLTYMVNTKSSPPPLRILLIFQQCLQIFARNFTQLLNNEIYILSLSWGINISENETICSFGAPRLRWREGPLNLWCSFSNLAHSQKIHGKAWSTRFGDLRVIRREWSWQLAPWRVLCRERARGLVTGVSQQLHYVSETHFQWRFGVTGVLWALFLCTVLCTLSNEPRILGRLLSRKIVKIGSFWALRR